MEGLVKVECATCRYWNECARNGIHTSQCSGWGSSTAACSTCRYNTGDIVLGGLPSEWEQTTTIDGIEYCTYCKGDIDPILSGSK